ncbi:MAG: LysR family transcriptional regulator [Gammaproteobacteria bacterium]|jgi:DNA-binding transcriptional LysR family regulator
MNNLNWNLIHTFLTVARKGSLSAAARELGVSQPTLSRDIQALETATELNLFKRTTQGLQLTEAGQQLVDAATRMDQAADLFARQASGMSVELQGTVRISANEIIGIYLLPAAIAAFRDQHPGVQIEIVITNQASSLSKREADIALRMFQPSQPDLVARRLPDMELGFYAHRDYIQKRGEPRNFEEFKQHTIIGFDEDMEYIESAAQLGYQFTRDNFALRTDHMLMQINLARAGAGIIGTHVGLAEKWSELERILEWIKLPSLEFWIVCHSDVQYNTRIRSVMQFLIQWFELEPYKYPIL